MENNKFENYINERGHQIWKIIDSKIDDRCKSDNAYNRELYRYIFDILILESEKFKYIDISAEEYYNYNIEELKQFCLDNNINFNMDIYKLRISKEHLN